MVEGGDLGGWPMVGIEGGYSARGGGFAAARQRVPALRIRPMGRSLAQESGQGRRDCRPIRRRSGGGLRKPSGSRAVSEGISGAFGEVRFGIACGKDAADRVRAVCRTKSETTWGGKDRNLHVPGLHALLREAPGRRQLHRLTHNGKEASGGGRQM